MIKPNCDYFCQLRFDYSEETNTFIFSALKILFSVGGVLAKWIWFVLSSWSYIELDCL